MGRGLPVRKTRAGKMPADRNAGRMPVLRNSIDYINAIGFNCLMITRRKFLKTAASLGACLAWRSGFASESKISWKERRECYPQGVGSGDPFPDSVILWTRRPPINGSESKKLTVEVAEDRAFNKVVATANAEISADTDWTCRVLAAGLEPRHVYWYRFTDEQGFGSRVGRTITAPSDQDTDPISFTFVSCQNVQQGACNAYRRMISEDEKRSEKEQIGFVLHLGDFVYEIVWYPEDRPQGMYDRRLRDIVRYPNGEKMHDFHIPTTLEDYRALYSGYLKDPDLQDARARWPFICVWDNHEFSWKGWQSQQQFDGKVRPAQKVRVAANQAWFEYQPARVEKANGKVDRFDPPQVNDAAIDQYDEAGLGLEQGNLASIQSLKIFRSLRFGKHVDLIITDNHSFRSEPVGDLAEVAQFQSENLALFFPFDALEILDAGRAYNNNHPPETIEYDGKQIPNPRKNAPPKSVLGTKQKAWFKERLRTSSAPWKLWGNSFAMLDWRLDLQNLPADFKLRWPSKSFGTLGGDWTMYRTERNEILDYIKQEKITSVVNVVGDRHSFFAGLLSASLPPNGYQPVAAEFITGSVSAPGLVEAMSYRIPKEDPQRPLFFYQPANSTDAKPTINFSILNGVRSSLTLQQTDDLKKALSVRNPDVSPHLSFVDMGGHGYSRIRVTQEELEAEFVCIPRPLERSESADGGPLRYRVVHHLKHWKPGESPRLERTKVEGDIPILF